MFMMDSGHRHLVRCRDWPSIDDLSAQTYRGPGSVTGPLSAALECISRRARLPGMNLFTLISRYDAYTIHTVTAQKISPIRWLRRGQLSVAPSKGPHCFWEYSRYDGRANSSLKNVTPPLSSIYAINVSQVCWFVRQ